MTQDGGKVFYPCLQRTVACFGVCQQFQVVRQTSSVQGKIHKYKNVVRHHTAKYVTLERYSDVGSLCKLVLLGVGVVL